MEAQRLVALRDCWLNPPEWSDIQTITTPSKDGLDNGAGIGAVIEAGLALGTFILAVRTRGGLDGDTQSLLTIGGIGAGIGAAADAATKGDPIVLYITRTHDIVNRKKTSDP